ncbi:HNH endonuclease [Cupriavidus necator]|uniref:HNH endonuclease n=1 Tax=Cupriavidus necator TaxID=106590 RepID=UPI0005B3A901|nr:HNH endonuclease domain-containing protein [Cupriavidus necator]
MQGDSAPTAEAQLSFLAKVQRLFAEGDFTATYKFALLIAFADLAVELGSDDGRELLLTNSQIGQRFIQLYWNHTSPYGVGRPGSQPGILVQNAGAQARVISAIAEFRARVSASSPQLAAKHANYRDLLRKVTETVSAQPLTYLQNFGGGTDPFIYERAGPGRIRLHPGVTYCLRRFQQLIQQLARSHWIDHIKVNRRNQAILGDADDLGEFLFHSSRQSLVALGERLRLVDGAKCFYCGSAVANMDVDHFIPFTLYPRDLAHNFVVAHPECNRSKSDMLAAKRHLEKWLQRLELRSDDLAEVAVGLGFPSEPEITRRVALWGYGSALASGGSAWIAPKRFEVVDSSYMRCFGA